MRREITVKKKSLIYIVLIVAVALAAVVLLRKENEKKLNDQIQLAEQFLSNRDYEAALREYQEACKIGPSDAGTVALGEKLYIAMAMEKELDGDIDGAIAILEEAIGTIPTAQDSSEFPAKLESLRRLKEEMQNPDLAGMTDELIQIVDEWRYYYDMAAEEDKESIFTSYADTFQKYIVLYESVYGTEECTCGQLYIDSSSTINDKGYFDLGTAYDFAIYFRLVTDRESTAWILRCAQAEKANLAVFLSGFTVDAKTRYEERQKLESSEYMRIPVKRTIQYHDKEGNRCTVNHNEDFDEGIHHFDRFGRLIAVDDNADDDHYKYEYTNASERRLAGLKIEGREYRAIPDITKERNVCMENLLASYALDQPCSRDHITELHGCIELLYIFRDGSIYSAHEYWSDYCERKECLERYYQKNTDEMWEHLEDWVYLGSFSAEEMEKMQKVADGTDRNVKFKDYLFSWEYSCYSGFSDEMDVHPEPKGYTALIRKMQNGISAGITFCIYQDKKPYVLWKTEEGDGPFSVQASISESQAEMELIYQVLNSDYYERWRTVSGKTGGYERYGKEEHPIKRGVLKASWDGIVVQ